MLRRANVMTRTAPVLCCALIGALVRPGDFVFADIHEDGKRRVGTSEMGDAVVAAPADGRFMATGLLNLGTRVQAGPDHGRIKPRLGGDGADRATDGHGGAQATAPAGRPKRGVVVGHLEDWCRSYRSRSS